MGRLHQTVSTCHVSLGALGTVASWSWPSLSLLLGLALYPEKGRLLTLGPNDSRSQRAPDKACIGAELGGRTWKQPLPGSVPPVHLHL